MNASIYSRRFAIPHQPNSNQFSSRLQAEDAGEVITIVDVAKRVLNLKQNVGFFGFIFCPFSKKGSVFLNRTLTVYLLKCIVLEKRRMHPFRYLFSSCLQPK